MSGLLYLPRKFRRLILRSPQYVWLQFIALSAQGLYLQKANWRSLRLPESDSAKNIEHHDSNLKGFFQYQVIYQVQTFGVGTPHRLSWNHEARQKWWQHIENKEGQQYRSNPWRGYIQSIIFVVARIMQVGIYFSQSNSLKAALSKLTMKNRQRCWRRTTPALSNR